MWLIWGVHINDRALYDTSMLGAIDRIDFDLDARLPPGERGSRAVTLAIEQDGYLWAAVAKRFFVTETGWTAKSISGLQASDFDASVFAQEGQPAMPDFSGGGPPISFGIGQAQSCPTTSDCRGADIPIEVDLDNWTVTVNETALSVALSVNQAAEPGVLTELPFEFGVSARVRNASDTDLTDVDLRFFLPTAALEDYFVPSSCTEDPSSSAENVIVDCTVDGPIGPSAPDDVLVPTDAVISVGYADTVADRSSFTYRVEIVDFAGRDEEPGDVLEDEVVLGVCNPSGMAPVAVEDTMDCDDLGTGGTGGTGGMGGTGDTDGNGGETTECSGCCGCDTANTRGSDPWLPTLALTLFVLWRLRRATRLPARGAGLRRPSGTRRARGARGSCR